MTATRPPLACLIGWPAAHSRSPLIHHYWLRTLGIEGGYVIEAVPPDDFRDFILRLSFRGFVGANVTRPHKELALALSKPDARAQAVGAANTLWFKDGELCSTSPTMFWEVRVVSPAFHPMRPAMPPSSIQQPELSRATSSTSGTNSRRDIPRPSVVV